MTKSIQVLFVDDEEHLRRATAQTLDLAGYGVRTAASVDEVLPLISRNFPGIIVTDIRMPGTSGMELLKHTAEIDPDLPVILVTGHGDITLAVEAMREGAYDFIEKPFASARFLDSVARAADKRRLTLEVRRLRDTVSSRWDNLEARLVGRSQIMVNVRDQIRAIAQTSANVLVVGDTGTGKEVVARAIHDLADQRDRPFVAINCAALPSDMIEAELFGYEAGAFAGATRSRFGKFEHARNGTIFFDGIEAMPLDVQAKLVRVIEERRITRLGSHEPIDLNARFIASSRVQPESAAETGALRRDLLYQLSVVTVHLPSLDQHREDIPSLFIMLARDAAARHNVPPPSLSQADFARLADRDWPGNIRQLRNVAERFVLGLGGAEDNNSGETASLADRVATFERQAIAAELEARNGRLKPVYESLGLSRKALYEKMQKYGLNRADYR